MNESPTLLAVFAHPDDESFRPGGTLALLARRGVRVHLLTATHGEAGSCGDPPLCSVKELPAVREGELRCACAILGIEPPRLLDYCDGHLSETDLDPLIMQICQAMSATRPQVVLTFGPDGLSGHPDHIAIGECALKAFHRVEQVAALYTVAVPQSLATRLGMTQVRAIPDGEIALTVDVSAVWDVKLAAIRCHATQLSSSPLMRAPIERQKLFFGTEYFARYAVRHSENDFLDKLFQGQGR
ncbi:MAG: PIG-L family deacetylase [Chloroflexi bacterium]|nr:PIG-L family deacetylase [Chloroflexota bacterium]